MKWRNLASKEQLQTITRFRQKYAVRNAVTNVLARNALDNADQGGRLAEVWSKADVDGLHKEIAYRLNPWWMVEEFGSYTNFFFGMLTLTAIILNLGNGLVRFVSELIDQGWDGGRTLARAIAAACGVMVRITAT